MQTQNTAEQNAVMNHIIQTIDNNCETGNLICLQGMGGSGKSTLCKKITAYLRSKGHIVVGCAATALAATVYDDFYTAHSLFKFPVEEDSEDSAPNMECKLHAYPERLQLIQQATLIIWDEWGSNHRNIYEIQTTSLKGVLK